jgi:uroporphyrinogen-III synthase
MTLIASKNGILGLGDNTTLQQLANKYTHTKTPFYLFNPIKIIPIDWQASTICNWQEIDKAIVISPHAAHYGLNQVISLLPNTIELFSIGAQTAAKIANRSEQIIVYPKIHTSESLLKLKQLQQLQGQRIVIFKGTHGRAVLQQTLQQRGAILYTVDCYYREPLTINLVPQLEAWKNHQVQQLIVTSNGSLQAFIQQVPANWQPWLKQLTLIVTSERLEQIARLNGFTTIKRAQNFDYDAINFTLKE